MDQLQFDIAPITLRPSLFPGPNAGITKPNQVALTSCSERVIRCQSLDVRENITLKILPKNYRPLTFRVTRRIR
jgi:hypothetical protein